MIVVIMHAVTCWLWSESMWYPRFNIPLQIPKCCESCTEMSIVYFEALMPTCQARSSESDRK